MYWMRQRVKFPMLGCTFSLPQPPTPSVGCKGYGGWHNLGGKAEFLGWLVWVSLKMIKRPKKKSIYKILCRFLHIYFVPLCLGFLQIPLWKIVLPRNFDTTVEYCWWNVKLENGFGAVEVLWRSSSLSHQPLLQHTCKPPRPGEKDEKNTKTFPAWTGTGCKRKQTHSPNMAVRRGPEQVGNPQNFDGEGPSTPSSAVLTPAADHQELNSLRDNRIDYHRWLLAATSSMDSCGTGWENWGLLPEPSR